MWGSIIHLALKLLSGVADYLGNRQLLEAGKAKEAIERLQKDESTAQEANAAAGDPANLERVRKKYNRPF